MAGFSDGFQSGLNMMFSAERLRLSKEELDLRKKASERENAPISDIDPTLGASFGEGTTVGQAKDITSIKASESNILNQKSMTGYRDKQGKLIDIQLSPERIARQDTTEKLAIQQAEQTLESNRLTIRGQGVDVRSKEELEDVTIAMGVYESMDILAQARKANPEIVGTVSYQASENNIIRQAMRGVENGNIDIIKTLNKDHVDAVEAISPIIKRAKNNPEEFSNLNLGDYNEPLNVLFSTKSRKYVGKKYIAEDGTKGKITAVNLDFNSFDIDPSSVNKGGKAILKGEFTYVDDQGKEHKKIGFLPDAAKPVIRETQQGTDAHSVSLTDMIDIASAVPAIIADAMSRDNGSMFAVAESLEKNTRNQMLQNTKGLAAYKVAANNAFEDQMDRAADRWNAGRLDTAAKSIGGDDATAESEAISKIFSTGFDIMSDVDIINDPNTIEELDLEGNGPFYRMKRNPNGTLIKSPIQASQDSLQTMEELETQFKRGTVYDENTSPISMKSTSPLNFNGTEIDRNLSSADYLPTLRQLYPNSDVDALASRIKEKYKNEFPNNPELSDFSLLEFLNRTLR